MKTKIMLSFFMLITLLFILASCTDRIERDADGMANLVRQRRDVIIMLLKANDSAAISQYQEKLLMLESEYSDLKNKCDAKYSDSSGKAQFEAAFIKALKRDAK